MAELESEAKMKNFLRSQFGLPHGLLGPLVGRIMAWENRKRNEWVVQQLPLCRNSRVLEVGFGPGVALSEVAKTVQSGRIVGVDPSGVMVAQATRRNSRAVQAGRMQLIHGTVSDLTDADQPFDVVFSVNALGRHADMERDLALLDTHLIPGSTLAVAVQSPYKTTTDRIDELRRITSRALIQSGFNDIQILQNDLKPNPITLVMGRYVGDRRTRHSATSWDLTHSEVGKYPEAVAR